MPGLALASLCVTPGVTGLLGVPCRCHSAAGDSCTSCAATSKPLLVSGGARFHGLCARARVCPALTGLHWTGGACSLFFFLDLLHATAYMYCTGHLINWSFNYSFVIYAVGHYLEVELGWSNHPGPLSSTTRDHYKIT